MPARSSEPADGAPAGFGVLLRAFRERAMWSQEQLADRSGVSVRTIGNLEQGKVGSPRSASVRLLTDALELSAQERQQLECAARRLTGAAAEPAAGPPWAPLGLVPCQLPPDVADFTGRFEQVTLLAGLLGAAAEGRGLTAVVVSAVAGKAGVGKTALAIHVAHQLRGRFPDGQLYVNLRGAEQQPLDATVVLARFLRALGLDGADIPQALEEREALYRARLADQRVLVVLDNAATEAQVRPLLPGTPECAVLVTSRVRLTGLEGARLVDLEVLEETQAVELLARIVGAQRVAAEPDSATEIVGFCGRLPLALRVAGARLAARPRWPLAQLAGLLVDERSRLDELAAGDLEVRASLALSYQALPADQQRALRLLGMLEVGDFSPWLAGPLLGIANDQAEQLVERLADAQLLDLAAVDAGGAGRYRFHDLVRLYARERAAAEESSAATSRALAGVTAGWLALAEQADQRLPGVSDVITTGNAPRWLFPRPLVERLLADPVAWLELERPNLVAAVEAAAGAGIEEPAWELAGCLTSFFLLRSYWASWERVQKVVLAACRQAGNRRGEAAALCTLGRLATDDDIVTISLAEARDMLTRALDIFRDLADHRGQAETLFGLADLERQVGLHRDRAALAAAVGYAKQALQLADSIGDHGIQADTLLIIGSTYRHLGRHEEAAAALEEARRLLQSLGARHELAITLWHLAMLARDTGRPGDAGVLLEYSLEIARELDDRRGQAQLLLDLGRVRTDVGRLQEADALVTASVEIWPAHTDSHGFRAQALDELGRLRTRQQRHGQAIDHLAQAAALWQELGAHASQARTLTALSVAFAAAGQPEQAHAARQQARALQQHTAPPEHPNSTIRVSSTRDNTS